jgi:phage protein D
VSMPTLALSVAKVPMSEPLVDAVQQVVVETALDLACAFSIRFGIGPTATGDWSILDVDTFRPLTPIGIRVGVGANPIPGSLLNGYVTAARVAWDDGGKSTLEVSGTDLTGVMNLEEKTRAWQNMPDGAIAAQIFGQYGVIPKVQVDPPRLVDPVGTTIQRGTDIRFLRRLARRSGCECYVTPEAMSGLDQGIFQPATLTGRPVTVLSVAMDSVTNVRDLSARYDMTHPTTVLATDVDTMTKLPQAGIALAATNAPMGLEPTLARLIAGGSLAGGIKPTILPVDTGAFTNAELQPAAQALADRSSFAATIEATTAADAGVIRAGDLIALRGAGRVFNGLYQATKVRLTVGADVFEQHVTARRNALIMTGTEAVGVA